MELTTRQRIAVAGVALLTAFAFGRYTTPVKVKIETKTVEVEKKTEDQKEDVNRDKHLITTTTETQLPNGTKILMTKTEEDDKSNTKTDTKLVQSDSITSTASKETTRGSSPVTLSLLGGIPLSLSSVTPIYGASVTKPVFGPVTIGIWGLSSREAGASVGLTF